MIRKIPVEINKFPLKTKNENTKPKHIAMPKIAPIRISIKIPIDEKL